MSTRNFYAKLAGIEYEYEPSFNALKAGGVGPKKSILIRGNSGDGQTAVALEIAKEFLVRDNPVLFFDYFDSIMEYRIPDFKGLPFILARPDGAEGTRTILSQFKKKGLEAIAKPVLCFDSSYLISDPDDIEVYKANISALKNLAFEFFPGSTVIMTDRFNRRVRFNDWTEVLEIDYTRLVTVDREVKGHEINLKGSRGEAKAFVDYRTGRLSKPYDWAQGKIAEGQLPSGYFDYQGERYRGLWTLTFDRQPTDEPE